MPRETRPGQAPLSDRGSEMLCRTAPPVNVSELSFAFSQKCNKLRLRIADMVGGTVVGAYYNAWKKRYPTTQRTVLGVEVSDREYVDELLWQNVEHPN